MATALGSAAEVLVATGHDLYARGSLRRPIARGWVTEGATAWMSAGAEERATHLSALGTPPAVATLLTELLPELPPRQRLTVPRGTVALVPAWVGVEGAVDWDFRSRSSPPAGQPGEEDVGEVVDERAVAALLAATSPCASALPGDAAAHRWWGAHGARGELLACVGDTSVATGVGHLSSLAVAVPARRRGLAAAVTAAATRALLAGGCDAVTLGLLADNAAARALCDRLGFADDHRFTSGRLLQRGRW